MRLYICMICIILNIIELKSFTFTSLIREYGTLKSNHKSFSRSKSSRSNTYNSNINSNNMVLNNQKRNK